MPSCELGEALERAQRRQVAHEAALVTVPREPGLELRRDQTPGGRLLLGGARSEEVAVLVLRMFVVSADPSRADSVPLALRIELLPELEVLDGPRLSPPPVPLPEIEPLAEAIHEVLAVGDETHVAGALEAAQRFDGAADRHAVVGRVGLGDPVVPPLPTLVLPDLDEPAGASGRGAILKLIAETGLVGVDVDGVHART